MPAHDQRVPAAYHLPTLVAGTRACNENACACAIPYADVSEVNADRHEVHNSSDCVLALFLLVKQERGWISLSLKLNVFVSIWPRGASPRKKFRSPRHDITEFVNMLNKSNQEFTANWKQAGQPVANYGKRIYQFQ